MKLRNKKTGQEGNFIINKDHFECVDLEYVPEYRNLAELNEKWEDYEEPKDSALDLMILTLTNFIENEPDEDKVDLDDCKQMLEKIKAWKRLKDKGFKFKGVTHMEYFIRFTYDKPRQILDIQQNPEVAQQFNEDINILFGGEK